MWRARSKTRNLLRKTITGTTRAAPHRQKGTLTGGVDPRQHRGPKHCSLRLLLLPALHRADLVRVPQRALYDPNIHPVYNLISGLPDPGAVAVVQLGVPQQEQVKEVRVDLGGALKLSAINSAGLEVLATAVGEVVDELAAARAVCSLQ